MSSSKYDVIIVRAGPAGIFAALELTQKPGLRVLILDKGMDIEKRRCPRERHGHCIQCKPCHLLSGWGGAGAFSDGKLTLSPEVGGNLDEYLEPDALRALIQYVDQTYVRFGASGPLHGADMDVVEPLQKKAARAGLQLVADPIRHMGTDRSPIILQAMRDELMARGVEIQMRTPVQEILTRDGQAVGIVTEKGAIESTFVVAAPGREGAAWLAESARGLGLAVGRNPVDVGVRVELPAIIMEPLTDALYESKLLYYSRAFDDKVRTFCMCPYGEVVTEYADGVTTVNGHSYANRKTPYTNFAILVSKAFTEPFKEPIAYGRYIARLANLLSGSVIVQRLGDLIQGRRSTPERMRRGLVIPTLSEATPGDLALVLPHRHLTNILEMLQAMNELVPGVYNRDTLLYGVEVKFYSSRLNLTKDLETDVKNLFAVGDGAGVTRGLVQASASGVVAARAILNRMTA